MPADAQIVEVYPGILRRNETEDAAKRTFKVKQVVKLIVILH